MQAEAACTLSGIEPNRQICFRNTNQEVIFFWRKDLLHYYLYISVKSYVPILHFGHPFIV